MIDIKNSIIKLLHNYIEKPVIPNANTKNRPPYPFIDYSIIANIGFDGGGNYVLSDAETDLLATLELQPKLSMSINAYSSDDTEAYNLAKSSWDYFTHVGETELDFAGVVVVDIGNINDRTILEVDEYERRYSFDIVARYNDNIDRIDAMIESYFVSKNGFYE